MNIEQIALVVKDAIREAARQFDVLPSQAFNPNNNNKKEIKARDMAIRLAFDQGIERKGSGGCGPRPENLQRSKKLTPCD
jgi:hypothetical protein